MAVVYMLGMLYMFAGLAYICDDYFVDSLEDLANKLNLSDDVAGATLMAMGSSAPELFTSFSDSLATQNDIGVSTIVGSAVFNLVVIVGLSGALGGHVLQLDWRPIARDCSWYCLSILLLAWFMLTPADNPQIDWYEALVLVLAYVAYIVYLSQNEKIMKKMAVWIPACAIVDDDDAELPGHQMLDESEQASSKDHSLELNTISVSTSEKRAQPVPAEPTLKAPDNDARVEQLKPGYRNAPGSPRSVSFRAAVQSVIVAKTYWPRLGRSYRMRYLHTYVPSTRREAVLQRFRSVVTAVMVTNYMTKTAQERQAKTEDSPSSDTALAVQPIDDAEENEEEEVHSLAFPEEGLKDRVFHVIFFPYKLAYYLTVPNCKCKRWRRWYVVTFVMSILWIAALSFFMAQWATAAACLCRVPTTLMGLVVVAAGTSVPDALSSIIVAREGQGDMAVSNAIGSNVFDILLGLGLPWLVSIIVYGRPFPIHTKPSEGLNPVVVAVFQLFGVLLLVLIMLGCNKWRLNKFLGGLLFSLYLAFVIFNSVFALA